jgi:hypothetical protein
VYRVRAFLREDIVGLVIDQNRVTGALAHALKFDGIRFAVELDHEGTVLLLNLKLVLFAS